MLRPKRRDFIGQEGQRVRHHRLQSRRTLPLSPERAVSKAAAWSRKAKRCVMAGRMSRPDWSITLILYQVSYISRP